MKLAHILVCHTTDPTKAIESIPHESGAIWYIFLHSDNLAIEQAVSLAMLPRDGNVFPYKTNRGLAKSWNDGLHLAMEAGCDAALLLNDDLFFYEGGYAEFVDTIRIVRTLSTNVAYVTPVGRETGASENEGKVRPQQFACCAISRECVGRIGYFDETFTPAYYEDVDYERRIQLSGMTTHIHPPIIVEHARSSTRRSMSEEDQETTSRAVARNSAYYHAKWGSAGDYTLPFANPANNLFIPFSRRSAPYVSA